MRAQRNRALDTFVKKRRVDGALLPVPHARNDVRLRIARGHREKFAGAAVDFDGVAGLRVAGKLADRAREHPRMATLQ